MTTIEPEHVRGVFTNGARTVSAARTRRPPREVVDYGPGASQSVRAARTPQESVSACACETAAREPVRWAIQP